MKKSVITIITVGILVFGFSGNPSAASNVYKVKKGDSLWKIAISQDVTVNQLKSWNGLTSDIIYPKQTLTVSNPSDTVKKKSASKKTTKKSQKVNFQTMTVKATAYTAGCAGCSGITATGINLKKNPNAKVISVDPTVIPLGTKVYVEGYGEAIAGDTGGAIKGKKIDLHMPSKKQALQWGIKTVNIKVYQ